MPNGPVFDLIFRTILQIDSSLIAQYTSLQDQILYLILIPHVILLLFIYAFSFGIVRRIIGEHKGFQYIIGIVIYLFLILAGWYGSILIPIFVNWMIIGIVIGLIVFVVAIVIHPARGPSMVKFGASLGQKVFKKGKQRKKLEKRLEVIDKTLGKLRQQPPTEYIQYRISQLEEEKETIEEELD